MTMGIAAIKAEMELEEWRQIILERENSGKTIRSWCGERGLSISAYYYRLRMLRENAYATIQARPSRTQMPKAEMPKAGDVQASSGSGWAVAVQQQPAENGTQAMEARQVQEAHKKASSIITVRLGKAEIDIRQGCDMNLLREVCGALVGIW
jgi:hypothetical protein